jgi:hypothetical protein
MMSLVFAAALMAGAPAAGEPAPAGATPAAAAATPAKGAKPKPDDMVCRREPVLGSRMKERICMTQAEWDARQQQDRDDLNKAQTQKPLTF